ncbi:MAG TPA: DUF1579 family protein [Actinomycetota bacterium]|nr:DUF1579 family protein [Actinomycetota bacterium]
MATPGPEQRRLDAFIGRWITEGQTLGGSEAPTAEIVSSDVYEWMPGGFFVCHTVHGRIGNAEASGTEIIGYDPSSESYRAYYFDNQGNVSEHKLTFHDGVWMWQGETTRATAVFSEDGKTLPTRHERSDDSVNWVPSMDVKLTKIE